MNHRLRTGVAAWAALAAAFGGAGVAAGSPGAAATGLTIPWMPGRMSCGKPGVASISLATRIRLRVFPQPAVWVAAGPVVPFRDPFASVFWWGVRSGGTHVTEELCRPAASQPATVGVHQVAVLGAGMTIACDFPDGVQVQGRWVDTRFRTAELALASGSSRAAVAVATMSVDSTRLTYDSRVCRRIPFLSSPTTTSP